MNDDIILPEGEKYLSERLYLADIVVDAKAREFERPYTYAVPPSIKELSVGDLALVPFGAMKLLGYIVKLYDLPIDELPFPANSLKAIIDKVAGQPLTQELIQLAYFLTETTLCGIGASVHAIAPSSAKSKLRTVISLLDVTGEALTDKQREIVERLVERGGSASPIMLQRGMTRDEFRRILKQLKEKGVAAEVLEVIPPAEPRRTDIAIQLNVDEETLSKFYANDGNKAPVQTKALLLLAQQPDGTMLQSELIRETNSTASAINALERKGLVVKIAPNNPSNSGARYDNPKINLTMQQKKAIDCVTASLATNKHYPWLLFGVTAGGKTEVYLRLISECIKKGRNALYLVPEIALTAQAVGQIKARFGKSVAILHSGLSDSERYLQYKQVQSGEMTVVVGARSAVFAPLNNIGLIVIDEEHEPSYKQEQQPRYHARDVAFERARNNNAVIVLGSATPSIETYFKAINGEYGLLRLTDRIEQRPMPAVEIIDMREQARQSAPSAITPKLKDAIEDCLSRKEQAILFLNRRSYAPIMLCRSCGFVEKCPRCSVSLAYHQIVDRLKCHQCEYDKIASNLCPSCKSDKLKPFGIGTQKVEEEAKRLFPAARITRLDRDVMVKKDAYVEIINGFKLGEYDILVGTQMVAKGLDFPRVSVVGVINADTGLHMPDFRSAERTFQLLTQVAGRSGRGDTEGKVLIQTFSADHPSVEYSVQHDYVGFYEFEIHHRADLGYPPYSRLANVIVSHEDDSRVQDVIMRLSQALRAVFKADNKQNEILGPAECPVFKVKNIYRRRCMIKARLSANMPQLIKEALVGLDDRGCVLTIDIDPVNMM